MDKNHNPARDLSHIKSMMEQSSRFISLSGLSGVSAGVVALIGAYFTKRVIGDFQLQDGNHPSVSIHNFIGSSLFYIAFGTLLGAFLSGFLFTYIKSKKSGQSIWGAASKRMLFNLLLPLVAGGLFLLKLISIGEIGITAPACLIFYGLALVNASKYTLGDIKSLGYLEILLGLINLLYVGQGLIFWVIGFGLAHILYGLYMWKKYDVVNNRD